MFITLVWFLLVSSDLVNYRFSSHLSLEVTCILIKIQTQLSKSLLVKYKAGLRMIEKQVPESDSGKIKYLHASISTCAINYIQLLSARLVPAFEIKPLPPVA